MRFAVLFLKLKYPVGLSKLKQENLNTFFRFTEMLTVH